MMGTLRRRGKRDVVKERVRGWIREQHLAPHDMLVSETRIAELCDVTPLTAHKALRELADEGLLYRVKGKGTFLSPSTVAVAKKRFALVLPGEALDREDVNPGGWHLYHIVIQAMHRNAGGRGFLSIATHRPGTDCAPLLDELRRCDAALFFGGVTEDVIPRVLAETSTPVAVIRGESAPTGALHLVTDTTENVRIAVRHLASRGRRRIAFIGSEGHASKFEGYRRGLADAGLAFDERLVVGGIHGQRDGQRGATLLLERNVPFDAVFVDTDLKALGVLDCLQLRGVRVPEDAALCGYDGFPPHVEGPPFLTTLRVPYDEMIAAALEAAARGDWRGRTIELPGRVIPNRT